MAKLKGIFNWSGTFQGMTTVGSRAYGDHIRKARTKFTLGKEMKESSELMKQANVYAKAFKDAIDPYRLDFRDGMLWQRLVSLFKKQIKEKGKADFSVLKHQDLNKVHCLSWIIWSKTTATQADNILQVHVASKHTKDPSKGRADGYEQTLIALFVDKDLQFQTFSESAIISLKANPSELSERQVTWTIPDGATTAIIVMKCNFSKGNKPMDLQKGMGMAVVEVRSIIR